MWHLNLETQFLNRYRTTQLHSRDTHKQISFSALQLASHCATAWIQFNNQLTTFILGDLTLPW